MPRSRAPRSSCICAGDKKGDEDKAQHLVRAASRNGTQHLVYISVVGADRIPGHQPDRSRHVRLLRVQAAAEQIVADSGLPWTTLRATQFHESMLLLVQQMAKLPVIPVPAGLRFQPIDAAEVADRLAELALGTPSGLVPDMAGPRVYEMTELVRVYLRARGKHRPILPVWIPGNAARAFRSGANLAPDRAVGHRTWEDFLASRAILPSAGASRA